MKHIRYSPILFLLILLSCGSNEPPIRKDITGIWRCEEINQSMATQTSYLLEILPKKSDSTQFLISNFHQTGDSEFIIVKLNTGKLSLTEQPTANISIKSFSGVVDNLYQIHLTYTVFDGQRDNQINAVLSRK